MLELYHAGLSQASVKVRTTLKEKGLAYKSHYLRLPEGEHLTARIPRDQSGRPGSGARSRRRGHHRDIGHQRISRRCVSGSAAAAAEPDRAGPHAALEPDRRRASVSCHRHHRLGVRHRADPARAGPGGIREGARAHHAAIPSGRNGSRPITAFRRQDLDEARAKIAYGVGAHGERAGASIPIWRARPTRWRTSTCCPRSSGCRAGRPI